MKFADIPQFVRDGSWECDFSLVEAVKFIREAIERDGLDIDPDFQRGHVWTTQQQINWIEFYLQGGRTGKTIYLNHPTWQKSYKIKKGEFVLVDGKQRYNALERFLNNEIKVFGHFFNQYEDRPSICNGTNLKININTLKTRKEVLQWYLGFNFCGTPHTEEELDRVRELLRKETNE